MGSEDHTFITTTIRNVRDVLHLAAGPASDAQGHWYLLIQIRSRSAGGNDEPRVDQFVIPVSSDLDTCLDALHLAVTVARQNASTSAAHD